MTGGPRDVAALVASIEPYDDTERAHQAGALAWLASTSDIYRRVRPATPPRHLVSCTIPVDRGTGACSWPTTAGPAVAAAGRPRRRAAGHPGGHGPRLDLVRGRAGELTAITAKRFTVTKFLHFANRRHVSLVALRR